jgi:hypothetical protein
MKVPVNFIGIAVNLAFLSASISYSHHVQILPRLWDWATTNASIQDLKPTSTGNLKFVKNAVTLLSEDLSRLGNAFTTQREQPVASTPKALPKATDADEQPAERTETVEANSGIAPPVTDNLNHPGTENPELVGAL